MPMIPSRFFHGRVRMLCAGCLLALVWPASIPAKQPGPTGGAGLADLVDGSSSAIQPAENPVTVSARLLPTDSPNDAEGYRLSLEVVAEIAPAWHVYSLTQPPGGPVRTSITITQPASVVVEGAFVARPEPHRQREAAFDNLQVETHAERVTWTGTLLVPRSEGPLALTVSGSVTTQPCTDTSCLAPTQLAFSARMAPSDANELATKLAASSSAPPTARKPTPGTRPLPPASGSVGSYQRPGTHTLIRGQLVRGTSGARSLELHLIAEPSAGFHVYALADRESKGISKPTLIVLENPHDWTLGRPVANARVVEEPSPEGGPAVRYYPGRVTWTVPIEIAEGSSGPQALRGQLGYQACTATSCEPPLATRFTAEIVVEGDAVRLGGVVFTPGKYADVAQAALAAGDVQPSLPSGMQTPAFETESAAGVSQLFAGLTPREFREQDTSSLLAVIAAALVGGFLLNFMPCVLPVVGLKLLAFVRQSGERRSRVLVLNLWYSAGVVSVFLVLATLASAAHLGLRESNLGWGEQFQSTPFNVAMTVLVFAMGLSFLGVWEIPIPGFVGSGAAGDLAAREGAGGALAKGMLSTLLATPCSGPFLGPVLGYTLRVPPYQTFLVFLAIGLGMASPYLLIGAFPSLIRFLPKPGAWMETFKHLMGFVLLGTVVYLFTIIHRDYLTATLALLVGVWFACWWIGKTSAWAPPAQKILAWVGGGLTAAAAGWVGFSQLTPGAGEVLAWRPFSATELASLTADGQTVLVDFTADWCLTCKANERFALNTPEVSRVVTANRVIAMKADYTDDSPEIKSLLELLRSRSVPLCAIFPAATPREPVVLRDLITKRQVIDALEQAGPSQSPTRTAAAN